MKMKHGYSNWLKVRLFGTGEGEKQLYSVATLKNLSPIERENIT